MNWRFIHGQLQTNFDQVMVECRDGAKIMATIVECVGRFPFNYYVAVLPSGPRAVRATSPSGAVESLTLDW
jgi:hypothetical protein